MIHKLSFSNFYSFKDAVTLDFTVDKNAPNTDSYFLDSHENRISKLMTVVGANASGKTNLLRSMVFLKWFISDSFSGASPKDNINGGFQPFTFCEQVGTSSFDVIFEIDKEIYHYDLKLRRTKIIQEILEIKNNKTNRWHLVFSRTEKNGKGYKNDFGKFGVSSDFEKIVRANSSALSAAKQIGLPLAIAITGFFSNILSNLDEIGSKRKNDFGSIIDAAEYFSKSKEIKEKAEKLLRRFDLGISKFEIEKFQQPDGSVLYLPVVSHKHDEGGGEASLTMFQESGGTRNLFVLLREILAALDSGNMVIFDELDNNLHPLMVPEIINLFRSKNYNPKNAQLLCTTHNVQILKELDKQQIILVEKNSRNISEAWNLRDVEGVRPDENYHAKYLSGVYGAVPKL